MNNILQYTNRLTRLKRGGTKYGLAPHKPLLLLSLIDLIEKEKIKVNQIPIDQKLFSFFSLYWRVLTMENTGSILMPLHHLKNEGLWKLIDKDGKQITTKFSSKNTLTKTVAYGQLEEGFFQLLQKKDNRDYFRTVLLDTYFENLKRFYPEVHPMPSYIQDIEHSFFEDIPTEYSTKTKKIEGYLRSWKFRHYIMRIYDETCCVSKLQVKPNSFGLIEACHIVSHAETGIQKIQNGIALSVNLHRAFDNGLISLDEKYRVLVRSKKEYSESASPYNIRQFAKQQILLPQNELYYPSQEYLAAHRQKFNF